MTRGTADDIGAEGVEGVDLPDSWESAVIERPGVRLSFTRTGGGKPGLVLLHGAMDNGLCWYRIARAFEDDFTIVMPDARGHGLTEVDSGGFTMSDMVDDVAGLIEHLDLAPAAVMGHSMGAQMATELAARRPELVDRVVLEDPAYRMSIARGPKGWLFMRALRLGMRVMRHRSVAQIRRFADRMFKTWSEEDKATWAVAQHQSARGSLKFLSHAFDRTRDWNAILSQIEAPTLLLTADKGLIKDDEAQSVMAALPHGERAHIASAGHNIRRDNYTDFMAAVSPFLQR